MSVTRLQLVGCTVDLGTATVTRDDGRPVPLTRAEVTLLGYLGARPGVAVSRGELQRQVLGFAPSTSSRAIDHALARLRAKIERDPRHPVNLVVARGVGVRLQVAAPAGVVEAPRTSLPAEPDAFVGRAADLDHLVDALAESRLVSILGPGGVGKTRLALHHARANAWPGGVWFCALADARQATGLYAAVAAGLDLTLRTSDPVAQIGHAIAGRGRCLVVLDNLEQLLPAAAATVATWLARAPEASFLVTSRRRLEVAGERVLDLGPLTQPDAEALFHARARAAASSYVEDPRPVAALVARLDHLPLAIELAAARMRLMTAGQALARVDHRFELLVSTGGRPARQVSLRATLEGSWELLAPPEQAALARLAVFEGGFTLDAATGVLDADAAGALQALVDRSLVRRIDDTRFDLLSAVKAFAAERLDASGARADAEARHGRTFAEIADDPFYDTLDAGDGSALRAAARDLDNLIVAVERAVARGDAAVAVSTVRLACAIIERRGPFSVGPDLARPVLAMYGLSTQQRLALSLTLSTACRAAGAHGEALAHGQRAAELAAAEHDRRWRCRALLALAGIRSETGEPEACLIHAGEALALARDLGDRRAERTALGRLAFALGHLGRHAEGRPHLEASLRIAQACGDEVVEGRILHNFALHLRYSGQPGDAAVMFERALALHRRCGTRRDEGATLLSLGMLDLERGDLREGGPRLELALARARETGDRALEGMTLTHLGRLAMLVGQGERARQHLELALHIQREGRHRYALPFPLALLALVDLAAGRLAEARRHALAAVSAADAYPDERTVALATMARVALAEGDMAGASRAAAQARDLDSGAAAGLVAATSALVAARAGDHTAAAQHIEQARRTAFGGFPEGEVGRVIAEAEAVSRARG